MSNILYCIPNFFRGGGTESRFLTEAKDFYRRGKKTYLLVREGFFDRDLYHAVFEKLDIVCLEFNFGVYGNISDTIKLVSYMTEIIQRYDIISVFTNYNHTIFAASIACHITKTKLITIYHASDRIHSKKKFEDYFFNYYLLPKTNLNLCVSQEVYEQKCSYGMNNCVLAPNLIDDEIFRKSDGQNNLLYWAIVSRLDTRKLPGILAFIDLLQPHDNVQVKICGDGDAKQALEVYIAEKGMSHRVDFLGKVSQKVVATTMQYALGVAGVGRVVIESAILGKPTVVLGFEKTAVKGMLSLANVEAFAVGNFTGKNYSSYITENIFDIDYMKINKETLDEISEYFISQYVLNENSYLDKVFENDEIYENEFLYAFYLELTLYQSSISESMWLSDLVKNNIFRRLALTPKYFSSEKEVSWKYYSV